MDDEDRIVALMMALPEDEYGSTLENIALHPTTYQAAVTAITSVAARKAANNYETKVKDIVAAGHEHQGTKNLKDMSAKDLAKMKTRIDKLMTAKSGRPKGASRKFRGKCFKCKKKGHMKKDCPLLNEQDDDAAILEDSSESDYNWSAVAGNWGDGSTAGYLVLDSGCTRSCFKDKRYFKTFRVVNNHAFKLGNGETRMESKGFGDVEVPLRNGKVLKMTNVAHCPGAAANYVAQRRLREDGYRLRFVGEQDDVSIMKDGDEICRTSGTKKKLFLIPVANDDNLGAWFDDKARWRSLWKWHLALGHTLSRVIKKMEKLGVVAGLSISDVKAHARFYDTIFNFKARREDIYISPKKQNDVCIYPEMTFSDDKAADGEGEKNNAPDMGESGRKISSTDIDNVYLHGPVVIFGGNLIHWRSKRQTIAVKSSAIAEYVALSEGLDELLWMRNLFLELDVKLGSSMVYEDNTACIRIAENPILSQKTKAVDLHFHYCRDHLQRGIYMLEYIPTDQQLADGLTKAVSGATLFKLAEVYLDTEAHVAPTKSAAEVDAGRSGASRGSVNVYRTYKLN
ncbi:hypothetical protein AAMO2058_000592200 [Amorphochlora amoebiformis]